MIFFYFHHAQTDSEVDNNVKSLRYMVRVFHKMKKKHYKWPIYTTNILKKLSVVKLKIYGKNNWLRIRIRDNDSHVFLLGSEARYLIIRKYIKESKMLFIYKLYLLIITK